MLLVGEPEIRLEQSASTLDEDRVVGVDHDLGRPHTGQRAGQEQAPAAEPAGPRSDGHGTPREHRSGVRGHRRQVLVGKRDEEHRQHGDDEDDVILREKMC